MTETTATPTPTRDWALAMADLQRFGACIVEGALDPEKAGEVRTALYRAAETDFVQALKRQGFRDDEIGTHAGLADTSLSLAVDPRLVRAERLTHGAAPTVADGVHGDPRRSSAAAGQAGVDLIVGRASEAIRRDVARR